MSDEKCPECGTDEFDLPDGDESWRCCNCGRLLTKSESHRLARVFGTKHVEAMPDAQCPRCGAWRTEHGAFWHTCGTFWHPPSNTIKRSSRCREREIARLRAVVEAMAGGDLTLSQTTDGTWQWAGEPADDMFYRWHGSFPSAADAGLAGLAK
ncbi:MAG TPA: hypothetical protein VM238_15860 [Phycisphaerae bacterium]|nr:hypothetical protein [Phycisphaerae bacterium]